MRFLVIIAFCVLGLIFGLGLGHGSASGYLSPWEQLPTPPNQITEFLPAGEELVHIKTLDGAVYRYDRSSKAWVGASLEQDSPNHIDVREPCDFSSPEFSFFLFPPRDVEICLQVEVNYIDGYARYAFVLDGNGRVWQWRLLSSPYKALAEQVCYPGIGLFAGACFGILAALFLKRKGRNVQPSQTAAP